MQLTLNLKLRDSATFENYLGDINRDKALMLQQSIQRFDLHDRHGDLFFFLWGKNGAGKSHLLQAACHAVEHKGGRAFYLSLKDEALLTPEVLQGCSAFDLICIDDIDQILGIRDWEVAIFNAYNEARAEGRAMVISGVSGPAQLSFLLPDLKSRMASGVTAFLQEPSDELKSDIIRERARLRGLDISEEVMTFIMKRSGRSMTDLVALLQHLDDLSLSAKRRLTVPFIKESLGW